MHPKVIFPGELAPLLNDMQRPLFEDQPLDHSRQARADSEVSLARGCDVDFAAFAKLPHADFVTQQLTDFLVDVMHVPIKAPVKAEGYRIVAKLGSFDALPDQSREAHRIEVKADETVITAADVHGLRRAVYRLQDHMLAARAAILPLGSETRSTTLDARIIRCPTAPYRWYSGWELEDENDYYPEAYLYRLARSGVNGLWVSGILRNLVPSQAIPELGPKQHRLDKLNTIIERAAKFGIDIHFFCMEPRALGAEHAIAKARPDVVGPRGSMCSSNPVVLEYTREIFHNLFKYAPGLAGAINIFCGERATTCVSLQTHAHLCPVCSKQPRHEMLAATLNACMEGMRSASPNAKLMAWTYLMATSREASPIDPMLDVMDKTDKDVIWLGNFDHGVTKQIWGKDTVVHEYCLSAVGPAPDFTALARETIKRNKHVYAKLQIGTSYELSSVPYLPGPGIAHDKIRAAQSVGCTGALLTWIPGGYPNPHHTMMGLAAFDQADHEAHLKHAAAIYWGEAQAEKVTQAWQQFDQIWRDGYPFDNAVLYYGPITRAAAYQLHLEQEPELAKPYNFGLTRKRVTQPFEDKIERWTGYLGVEQVYDAFRRIGIAWQQPLKTLEDVLASSQQSDEVRKQVAVAKAVGLQCLCAANVYEFYMLRDELGNASADRQQAIIQRLIEIAKDEIDNATAMLDAMAIDASIGFENEIYAYSFSPSLVREKILQVSDLLPVLESWQQHGVDMDVLQRTTAEAEALVPDRIPDRWGD